VGAAANQKPKPENAKRSGIKFNKHNIPNKSEN
jgi:hypothetical protein